MFAGYWISGLAHMGLWYGFSGADILCFILGLFVILVLISLLSCLGVDEGVVADPDRFRAELELARAWVLGLAGWSP